MMERSLWQEVNLTTSANFSDEQALLLYYEKLFEAYLVIHVYQTSFHTFLS